MERTYTVVLIREREGGYSVHVPALKGCHTQGEDLAEALRMAQEAISLFLETLQAHGEPIPEDTEAFVMDMGEASEALVVKVKVSLPEEAAVA